MKNKIKYILEVTEIKLIPCKTKAEAEYHASKLNKCPNMVVYTQKEFKEAYGKEYDG